MAELVTIARPYAEAVFKLAREQSSLGSWSEALALLEAVIQEADVKALLRDPNVSTRELEGLVLGALGDRLPGSARNLVQVMLANGRLELVPQVRALYEVLRREHESVVQAQIIAALPVTNEQLAQLVARLEASYQRRVEATVEVDPALIGGVRIVVGDKVIDATVRGRLDAMAATLAH
jgi:F-type H+-transporting ATPase subunit delta